MGLKEQWNDSCDGDLCACVLMAMCNRALKELVNLKPGDPNFKPYAATAKNILTSTPRGAYFATRALTTLSGVSVESKDPEIQAAVDAHFDTLSKLFDPTIGQPDTGSGTTTTQPEIR